MYAVDLSGFYIIDCKDDADAVRQAARVPVSRHAWIQARKLVFASFDVERIAKLTGGS